MFRSLIPLFFELALCFSLPLVAESAFALNEADFLSEYQTKVVPLLQTAEEGTLAARDGHRLVYHLFQRGEGRPAVVVLTGYAESWLHYAELVWELDRAGYDVFVMDHRGMGFSGRLAPNPKIAHINDFDDYVNDAQKFVNQIVQPRAQGPLHLLGHSMGGLVAAFLVEREPKVFRSVVLSAPLFQMNTGFIPEMLAYGVVSLQVALGEGSAFAPGRGAYDPMTADPERCNTTHSAVRCGQQIKLYQSVPESFLAGPSNQWVKLLIRASQRTEELARAFGSIPVLILQAEDDAFVRPKRQNIFCARANRCTLRTVPHSYHDLFHEKDTIRDRVVDAMLEHFKRRD